MNADEYKIKWLPLPRRSSKRIGPGWDKIFEPLVGIFSMGGAPEGAKKEEECRRERLKSYQERAARALAAADKEFTSEADQLKKERYVILGVALLVSLVLIALGCGTTSNGYEIIKSVLATTGTGGLLTWSITFAFRRIDHESQLRMFPKVFAPQFEMCIDCEQYKGTFERFARAAEALRGARTD